ncbi:nuclear transport factor 2 family protein [Congregibacter sp.]|uniref:nuclear transport factor 2 family protein n=1 Tax=Congregibacter sp. TaxID=2744308 RepID=UPI003F6B3137
MLLQQATTLLKQAATKWLSVISAGFLFSNVAVAQMSAAEKAPDAEAFLAMDREVIAAFLKGDADGYAAPMSDDFFLYQGGYRAGKDYAVGMVSTISCDVSDPLKLSSPHVTQVNKKAYVLSYRMDIQATCSSGDISITLPTPVRAATLWVYKQGSWQIAYHGENAIVEPTSASDSISSGAADSLTKEQPAPKGSLLDSLWTAENAVWETWRAHDANALTELTAGDISFVNVFGDYFATKADTIANWTGPFCDVDSFTLSNSEATQVLSDVAVLTLTGSIKATCGEQHFADMRVYATTVYVKTAEGWKWAFGFNSP